MYRLSRKIFHFDTAVSDCITLTLVAKHSEENTDLYGKLSLGCWKVEGADQFADSSPL